MHCTSGTTGTPKGVWSGLLSDADAAALVAEERSLWGFADTDVNLVLSPLYHSAPLRFAMGTALAGGRVVLPGPFDPAVGHRSDRAGAADDDVLRADPPAAAVRALGRGRDAGPLVVPAGRARRGALSGGGQAAAARRRSPRARPGSSTARPRVSSPPAAPRSGSSDPGRSAGPGRAGCCRTDADGTIWCAVPPFARFTYFGDPARPRRPGGRRRTVRRSPSATSAGSTQTATSSSTAAARTS